MTKRFKRALFIFRRDLRLEDNTALNAAAAQAHEVCPIFIFDPRQVGAHPYFSAPAFQFMRASLLELQRCIQGAGGVLYFYFGQSEEVVEKLLREAGIDSIFFNRDYTPFSRNRDLALKRLADAQGVAIFQFGDALLHEPEIIKKKDGGPYTVFTPFFKNASMREVSKPNHCVLQSWGRLLGSEEFSNICDRAQAPQTPEPKCVGGRSEALRIIEKLDVYEGYLSHRDIPALDATTHLSPHHKFGTISVREVYWSVVSKFGSAHAIIRELFWRDFFTHIAFHFPYVFTGAFHRRFDSLAWSNRQDFFEAWCAGHTGFPIVDAGMRELAQTGFMHNRVRMIVASFLVKDLLIDWRWGERFFAQKLLDYDPAVNNGNWQWVASSGCDAQPYFRIFNPWLQQEKFDPEAIYVKRWCPELKGFSAKEILQPGVPHARLGAQYPAPIVDHDIQKAQAIRLFEASK